MNDNVFRYHYRGHLNDINPEELVSITEQTKQIISEYMKDGKIMTACIYRFENMLFAYYEAIGEEVRPEELFAPFSACLLKWPGQAVKREWVQMNHIYYHAIPEGKADWERKIKPELQRGRIAFLKPEKMFSYVYHHVAITDEGLLHGDKYQSIALHENILFSYFEEPKTEINIKRDLSKDSNAIDEWLRVIPEDHFIRGTQNTNFTFIPALIAMGQ
jgi:hypothetical protein